jgi:sugar lactone lactonase YvrE
MRKTFALLVIATPLLLSGCGGGGSNVTNMSSSSETNAELSVLAGSIESAGSVDAAGSAARFQNPTGIAVDGDGNVYVADGGSCIRKINPAGTTTTIAGICGESGLVDGNGSTARFSDPLSLAVDNKGNVYVADFGIRKIDQAGIVSTLEHSGPPQQWDGIGPTFGTPYRAHAVAVDGAGNVYSTYTGYPNTVIQKINLTGAISILAGSVGVTGSSDGAGGNATFNGPSGLKLDSENNVYVADTYNSTIRKISPTGVVTTLAGTAGSLGTNDGIGAAARFSGPSYLAVDRGGSIYVTDTANSTIRKVSSTGVVTTVIGKAGNSGAMLKLFPEGIYQPGDLAIDANGVLYVIYGNAILKIRLGD